jgi:hypothetical protein
MFASSHIHASARIASRRQTEYFSVACGLSAETVLAWLEKAFWSVRIIHVKFTGLEIPAPF